MSYINETDFVIENKKLVYPEIVSDGLQLYYDAKGKRDTDYHRDTMLDMSGNKNHGKLHNFAYEKHSGYKDGLVFDYIDDKLVRPTLNLKPDDFTFMLNGNIISFSPDGTVKRVQDGEVIESKGFNLIKSGDFTTYNPSNWSNTNGTVTAVDGKARFTLSQNNGLFWSSTTIIPVGHKFYTRLKYKQSVVGSYTPRVRLGTTTTDVLFGNNDTLDNVMSGVSTNTISVDTSVRFFVSVGVGNYVDIDEWMMFDLTETFGVGKEPTKEQMDDIINRFGFIPNAQDLIDRIEYKGNTLGDMENIIDGLYKTEVLSGEEIYTSKADDDAVVHVEVDGKSYQHAGSGKNLAPHPKNWKYISGASYNEATDEIIIPIGSSSVEFWIRWDGNKAPIYLSFDTVTGGGFLWNTNYFAEDRNTRVKNVDGVHEGNGMVPKWTSNPQRIRLATPLIDNNVKWVIMKFTGSSSYTPSEVRIKNVKVSSSNEIEYELPALTPEYPVEIHSLNDFDVVSSVGGRNLILNSQLVSNSPNNTGLGRVSLMKDESTPYYRVIGDKIISTYGFDGSATSSRFSEPMINGATYTVSVDVRAPRTGRVSFFDGMGSQSILKANEWIRIKHTYTYKGMSYRVIGLTYNSSIIDYRNWKIEKGSTATDWAPAPEDNLESDNHPLIDKINLLLDEPLRSVGDVSDRLFRDSDGIWKIERNVGEMVLDGSRGWSPVWLVNNNHGAFILRSFMPNINFALEKYNFIKSDKFVGVSRDDLATTGSHINKEGIAQGANYLAFRINIDRIGDYDVETFQNWLRNNPVTIYYYLSDKSYIETLNQELQDKLNNLCSFEGSNYVYTVLPNENNYLSNSLKPTLHARFLYNNWYKEDRVINNLMIYNRALTNEEMLQNYKTIKRRWGM